MQIRRLILFLLAFVKTMSECLAADAGGMNGQSTPIPVERTNASQVLESSGAEAANSLRVHVAGTLYVDLSASHGPAGGAVWTNYGVLDDFTRTGSPVHVPDVARTGIPGVQFNGTTDAFIGPASVPDLEGGSDRSIEAWVFNPAVGDEETILEIGHRGKLGCNCAVNYGSSLLFGAATQWAAYDVGWGSQTNVPSAGAWHHLVYTYDGATTCRIHVDGQLRITKTLPGRLATFAGERMLIGAQRTNTASSVPSVCWLSGFVNSIRVHGGVLNAQDIAANYALGPSRMSDPPPVKARNPVSVTAQPAAPRQWLPLTNISQCLKLSGAEAGEGPPVRIEGTVVYADPIRGEVMIKDATGAMPVRVDLKAHPAQAGQSAVLKGTTTARIIRYPDFPSGRQYLTSFEAPVNLGEHYVSRVRGYLYPPRTGEYSFWIAADNQGSLYLSTDETTNHVRQICGGASFTASRGWDKNALQHSTNILLTAGRKYYIEAWQLELEGEDCLAVAWSGPGIDRAVIDGRFLSPWEEDSGAMPAATGKILREFWLNYPSIASASYVKTWMDNPPTLMEQPGVIASELDIVNNRSLPDPVPITPGQSQASGKNFQWAETGGVIVEMAGDGVFWSVLELAEGDHMMKLRVANPGQEKLTGLLNARVRVRGFSQGILDERGEQVAGLLWVPGVGDITLVEPRQEDWARLTVLPLSLLTAADSPVQEGQRVRIRGRVFEQQPGESLSIRASASRVSACISRDGTNWSQVGDPIGIQMNNAIHVGLAIASRSRDTLSTGVVDHVSINGITGGWTNVDIGAPALRGGLGMTNGVFTLRGSGGAGRTMEETSDQLHFAGVSLQGDGEIVARVASLEGGDTTYASAGIMLRETLDPDSRMIWLAMRSIGTAGAELRIRRGVGNPSENMPCGQKTSIWLKLVRQGAERLLVRTTQNTPVSIDQRVDVMGVLERTNQHAVLNQAFYRAVSRDLLMRDTNAPSAAQSRITAIQQIRQFTFEELAQGRPVVIRGVITSKADDLYVQDSTAGIRIPSQQVQRFVQCEAGQYIEVSGRCAPGGYSPVVYPFERRNITLLGQGRMPETRPSTWIQLMSGTEDAQWVEVNGVVRSVEGRILKFQMLGGVATAVLDFEYPETHARGLVDALVRIKGVCKVIANDNKQLVGFTLLIPSPDCVSQVRPSPENPFNRSANAINDLLKFDPQRELFHRVKIEGTVTHLLGKNLFVQDATGGVLVETMEKPALKRGDTVEVVGFAEPGGYSPVLAEALVRKTGSAAMPEPALASMNELLAGKHDARRVRLEAVFLGQKTEGRNQVLECQSERRTFRTMISTNEWAAARIPVGSRVAITGVFKADNNRIFEGSRRISSFQVYVDSREDVDILERPAWWTLKHTVAAIGILVVVLGGALVWIRMLRRRVEERTMELKAEIEEHKRTEIELQEKTTLLEDEVEERKRIEVEKERMHSELMAISRRAGMAEVATGVLHNVGNVLNSVNVAATLIAERTRKSRISSLVRLNDLISEHAEDLPAFLTQDPKGRQIPGFMKQLAQYVQREQKEVLDEVASLTKSIDHIKKIVAVQQEYARSSDLKETLSLRDLVEDAVRIDNEAFTRHKVRLIREFQEVPPMIMEKHKVLQILVNLLSNARHACDAVSGDEKCVWIRIDGDEQHGRVSVRDNGTGIAPENLVKIFQHGFTTRKDGHGFGLHNCANSAREMGGHLVVESGGLGKGATFVLTLPR